MSDTAEFEVVPQAEIQSDLRELFRGAVKLTLETVLEEVVRDMVGAGRWARCSPTTAGWPACGRCTSA